MKIRQHSLFFILLLLLPFLYGVKMKTIFFPSGWSNTRKWYYKYIHLERDCDVSFACKSFVIWFCFLLFSRVLKIFLSFFPFLLFLYEFVCVKLYEYLLHVSWIALCYFINNSPVFSCCCFICIISNARLSF